MSPIGRPANRTVDLKERDIDRPAYLPPGLGDLATTVTQETGQQGRKASPARCVSLDLLQSRGRDQLPRPQFSRQELTVT